MKPAPFEYRRAASVEQALAWLREEPEARVIAGGQTLMPMLAMRLVRPSVVIDIARIAGLDTITVSAESVTLGAMVRQADLGASAELATALPLLARAIRFVGHPPTRRRGTVGGSLANADPAAELALVAVTLGATLLTTAGEIAAAQFFAAPMTTALPAGALLLGVRFPRRAGGAGFAEMAMRQGDYALAAAACVNAPEGLRLAVGGCTPVPVLLAVRAPTRDAVAAALAPLEMLHDPNAGAPYRRRAALALAMQAMQEAGACA